MTTLVPELTLPELARMMDAFIGERHIWVYFIQVGTDGPIKVGISAEPFSRLKQLRTSHYEPLHLIGAVWASKQFEQAIHAAFAEARLRNEWFSPTPELIGFAQGFAGVLYEAELALAPLRHKPPRFKDLEAELEAMIAAEGVA